MSRISSMCVPMMLILFVGYALYKKVNVYDAFIEGAKEDELCPAENMEEALEQVKALVEKGMRGADACREIAKATGFSKGELYGRLFK